MSRQRYALGVGVLLLLLQFAAYGQKAQRLEVPNQIRFTGVVTQGKATGARVVGVLFSMYGQQTGGAALWQESQNVQVDDQGRYTVVLGSSNPVPLEVFAANEARWLGIQVLADAEPEQPRMMLVSVPYALKAQDADTLGGLPASAFLRADAGTGGLTSASGSKKSSGQAAALELEGTVSADPHTTNAIPKFTSTTDTLADSMMFELYDQVAVDAAGHGLANEDVVKLGDGTGRKKRFEVDGRLVGQGFDMVTTLPNAVHAVSTYVDGVGMQANADGIGFSSGITGTSRGLNGAGVVGFALPPLSLQPQAPGDYALGVLATNYHPQGAALEAFNAYDGTALGADFPVVSGNIGVYSGTAHSSAIPLVLEQLASSGPILSARAQGTEVASMNSAGDLTTSGSITATGTITAASFSGDGSGLTGVSGSFSDPAACPANQFVTDLNGTGALTCAQPSSSNLSDGASLATKTYADAGDAALAAPQYVTLATSGTLSNERVLTAGKGISITDAGAGSTVTVDQKTELASAPTSDSLSSIALGGAEFATTYTIPANTLTAGMVIEVWASGLQTTDASGMSFGYGIRFGSTDVLTAGGTNAGIFQNANTAGSWNLEAKIIVVSVAGSTATLEARGINTNASSASSWATRNFYNTSTVTVDPTVAQTLKVAELVNTNGSDSTDLKQLIVKILK